MPERRAGSTLERLQGALDTLASLGAPRGRFLTLESYLGELAAAGLLAAEEVEACTGAYRLARFGGREPHGAEAERATAVLSACAESLAARSVQERRALADRLLALASSGATSATAAVERTRLPHEPSPAPEPTPPADQAARTTPPRVRWLRQSTLVNLIIVALFCWSVACMVFGAWGWPHAGNTARDLRRWVRGLGVRALGVEEPAAGVRALALEHTGEASHWWTLAEHHQRREEYADAIAAYHHALARAPEHPIILNNLAWLLCTAEDPLYRDPVQARELAQRAYKIKPSPFITDTLAEAIFQNGDPVRAVALEEEALAKNPPERPLYQKQLLKFRTAAQQVAARGPAGVSAETVNGSAQE